MENEPRPTNVRPITSDTEEGNIYYGTLNLETGELVIEPKKD